MLLRGEKSCVSENNRPDISSPECYGTTRGRESEFHRWVLKANEDCDIGRKRMD